MMQVNEKLETCYHTIRRQKWADDVVQVLNLQLCIQNL
jgi:hypothetical protein